MSLSRFFSDPFYNDPFADFDRLFDNAFAQRARIAGGAGDSSTSQALSAPTNLNTRFLKPKMDVHENTDSNTFTATFELPGLKKEDVQIDVHNNRLTVSGESSSSYSKDENGWAIQERSFGKFSRTLPLPQDTNLENIKASMENGVLSVTFPKANPQENARRITIN